MYFFFLLHALQSDLSPELGVTSLKHVGTRAKDTFHKNSKAFLCKEGNRFVPAGRTFAHFVLVR